MSKRALQSSNIFLGIQKATWMPRAMCMLRKDLRRPQAVISDQETVPKYEVKAKAEL